MPQPQPFIAPPMPHQQSQHVPPQQGVQHGQPQHGQPRHGQPQQQQQQQQRAPPVREQRPPQQRVPQQRPLQPATHPTLRNGTTSSSNTSRMAELSQIIAYNTSVLDAHLTTFGKPAYSFARDAPPDRDPLIPAMEARRKAIEEASLELHELVQHPRALTMDPPAIHAAKAFIAKFEIAKRVPPNGDVSYTTLSEITGVDQGALETMLRLAISHRIFSESEQDRGRIAHSPASRWLAEDSAIHAGKTFADYFLLHTAYLSMTLDRFPRASEPAQAAAAVALGGQGEADFYQMLAFYPEPERKFYQTMRAADALPGLSLDHLIGGFEWRDLPPGALCVQIGGGHGAAAFALAQTFPHLNWIVQDSWAVLRNHPDVPEGLNVAFMAHDFHQPQTHITRGARVFLLRRFLHDLPDAHCSRILRGLIPSLQCGSRVLINERILKAPGTMAWNGEERAVRAKAVEQLALSNGRERDREAWRRVVMEVDPTHRRLRLEQWREPEGSDLGIVELVWIGTGQVNGGVAAGEVNAATVSSASGQGRGYGQEQQLVNGNGNVAAAPVGHGQDYGTMVGVLAHESAVAPSSGSGQAQTQRTASGELRGANANVNGSPVAANPASGQGQEMKERIMRNEEAAAAFSGLGRGQRTSDGVVRDGAALATASGHGHNFAPEAMDGIVSNVTVGAAPLSHVREQRMTDLVAEYKRAATAPVERTPGQGTRHGVVENGNADAVPSGSGQGHEAMEGVVKSGPSTPVPAGREQRPERMDEGDAGEPSTRGAEGSWPGALNGGMVNPPTSPWGRRDWERMMGLGQ